jgi:membrane-associated phospholipid phosphatase
MLRLLVSKMLLLVVFSASYAFAQSEQIEPNAGSWRTWIISSGKDFRVPPPPDASATANEIAELQKLMAQSDPKILEKIRYWDAGSPAYRWMGIVNNRFFAGEKGTPFPNRINAYLAIAMYDATIAAWESKYFYNRPRPGAVDPALRPALPTPKSPSYPSEHAATAEAAKLVLAYFFPKEAALFESMATEAAQSRLQAGVEFPSDSIAGRELGRRVAERVIERAKADGSDAVWSGTIPTGPCKWTGTNPGNVTLPNWKPILLKTANEFRPPAPPDCKSEAVKAEADAVRQFERTFATNSKAFYWQSPAGVITGLYDYANAWMFEDKTDQNAPRAARVYALLGAVFYDALIASNDGKFTYWYLRPHQLDPEIKPLFPVPNFPSYPSNHSTLSSARCEVLAYLFPTRAEFIRKVGKEAGDSRIWAGIHYQMDNQAGVEWGKKVAGKYVEWAKGDGS